MPAPPVEAGFVDPSAEAGFVDIPPDDPAIRVVGRATPPRPDGRTFAFPGVSIQLGFTGDAIDLKLADAGRPPSPAATNYYDVIIDGQAPRLLMTRPDRRIYPLARGLAGGEHTLALWKRVEAELGGVPDAGKATLLGFRVRAGEKVRPVQAKARKIEFIGDSITCGYGDEIATTTPDDFPYTTRNSNARLAYGALIAEALDADYVAVAASGRGVIRNYEDKPGATVPELYTRTFPDDPTPAWDPSWSVPDVIVVNLGTNDFSPGIVDMAQHRARFRDAYEQLLARLRTYYPSVVIVAVVGPMLNDAFPEGYHAWTSIQADVREVVARRSRAGDGDVHYVKLEPQAAPYGEDWHPTLATHRKMAAVLVPVIKALKGW